jgi:hypothetical protein
VKVIRITCKGADTLPIDLLEEFQGNLKKRGKKEIDKIIKSIEKYGFCAPFFVWNGSGHNYILDGHGRLQALVEMRRMGEDLPLFPVDYIDAVDEDEAKQKLLRINSSYGEMSIDSILEFTEGLDMNWEELDFHINMNNSNDKEEDIKYKQLFEVIIDCDNQQDQERVYNELRERDYKCRLSTL